ncbi:hypothetical protein ACTG23_22790 [Aeromonas enteropelogenes]|uniref:hypothetical protein n=1 Tax=Aeromonas enteropelogenes TaxID=29489 RepID=UPI003F7A02FA
MKKILVVSTIATFLSACSSLQGVVRDKETGTPVPSALIKVREATGSTDAMGHYRVMGSFLPGDTLMINAPGYNIYTQSIMSANDIVDIELTKQK